MPTPRAHGGAPLTYRPLNNPGFRGLNTQASSSLLGPEWATRLQNAVIDTSSRLACRKGWESQTNTPISGVNINVLHEETSTGDLFACGDDNKLYRSQDNGGTWSDITNTATVTDDSGQFHDFNGVVLYVQSGQKPCVYGGTNFTDVADANAPTGGVSLASFGRVWGVTSTGKSVRYSALLDHTDWTTVADAGLLDMTSIWQRDDEITALANFNGSLVVFSNLAIVVFTDNTGSVLGIDPAQMTVRDIVSGVGCVARDSVVNIEGDVWFLSPSGLMSLGRLTINRDNPLNNISRHVQDFLFAYITVDTSRVRAVYSPVDRFYLLSLPSAGGVGTETCFCFDTRHAMQDGSYRCTGTWDIIPRAMVARTDGELYFSTLATVGEVGRYSGFVDDEASYQFDWESGWSDFGSPYVKVLKRITHQMFVSGDVTITSKWAFDFMDTFATQTITFENASSAAEYGTSEWAIAEYNGGTALLEKNAAGTRSGEHIKVGMTATIENAGLAIQQISIYAKTGRLK